MKKKEKRMILILLIILAIVAIIFITTRGEKQENINKSTEQNEIIEEFVQVLEDGTKLNTSTKLSETKTVEGLEIGNIQLTNENGQSVLLADVTNNSGETTDLILIDITLLDKQGNELGTVGGIISPLEIGETTQLNTSMMKDYANAYDFKVIIK